MPYRFENGKPVHFSVHTGPTPPEIPASTEFDEVVPDVLYCPHCGRDYKTQAGLDNHIETKHDEEE